MKTMETCPPRPQSYCCPEEATLAEERDALRKELREVRAWIADTVENPPKELAEITAELDWKFFVVEAHGNTCSRHRNLEGALIKKRRLEKVTSGSYTIEPISKRQEVCDHMYCTARPHKCVFCGKALKLTGFAADGDEGSGV